MAKNFQFDSSITADIKAVACDSFKDNVKMIEIKKIKPFAENFYSINEIELLADDIERQGLKHNLVVCEDKENPDSYFLKSGHRRFTAIKYLINNNRYNSNYVPCLIDGNKTESENMLDLIMLNATTRVMNDSEIFRQYEILKNVLENLKSEGKKVSGRLRENIAKFLNVSPAQIGKIENIKHNAVDEIKNAVESGDISIATANSVARLPEQKQKELISEKNVCEITSKDTESKKSEATSEKKMKNKNIKDNDNFSKPDEFESDKSEIDSDLEVPDDKSEDEKNIENYRQRLIEIQNTFAEKVAEAVSHSDINKAVIFMQSQLENIKEEINNG